MFMEEFLYDFMGVIAVGVTVALLVARRREIITEYQQLMGLGLLTLGTAYLSIVTNGITMRLLPLLAAGAILWWVARAHRRHGDTPDGSHEAL